MFLWRTGEEYPWIIIKYSFQYMHTVQVQKSMPSDKTITVYQEKSRAQLFKTNDVS